MYYDQSSFSFSKHHLPFTNYKYYGLGKKVAVQLLLFSIVICIFLGKEGITLYLPVDWYKNNLFFVVSISSIIAIFLLLIVLYRWFYHAGIQRVDYKKYTIGNYCLWVGVGYLVICLSNIVISFILGLETTNNNELIKQLWEYSGHSPWFIFSVVVLAPLYEELVFRRYIIDYLGRGTIVGLLIATFAFAAVHVIHNFKDIYLYLGMSFVISFIYYKTRKLRIVYCLHFLNNLISVLLLFYITPYLEKYGYLGQ